MGSNPTRTVMKRFVVSITVDTAENVTCDDVEWAVRDLFDDFTIGRMCGIIAEEIKMPDWCHCGEKADIIWDGFGGGTCKICNRDTF